MLAALRGETGPGGGIKIDAPRATDKEISLAIMEAEQQGLVQACEVANFDSTYREWKLIGPTGKTQQYLRETHISRKVLAVVMAIAGAILGFIKWGLPILADLWKK